MELMKYVVGVDEAGRGPLAGPVAVGVARAKEGFDFLAHFEGLNDSKKMTEKARERIFIQAQEYKRKGDIDFLVVVKSAKEIDEKGIASVIVEAIAVGVQKLLPKPHEGVVYLDGALRAPSRYEQETVIGGDGKIPAIMLASVMAKVMRDRLMVLYGKEYPNYNFAAHKGYGTKLHIEKIREHGLCDIHRQTFIHLD